MPEFMHRPRLAAAAFLVALSVLLSGCLLTPGKFNSTLDLRRDGRFTFTYSGEIHLLAMSRFADMARGSAKDATFVPKPCSSDDGAAPRPCRPDEIQDQKRQWTEDQDQMRSSKQRESASMREMFGGIDPADPQGADELASRLRRQAGWRKVINRGEGLFEVDFTISGQLDRDFTFPMIERVPLANPFVQVFVRSDRTVRIDAPGYSGSAAGGPYRGIMQAEMAGEGKDTPFRLPEINGTFTVTTDGEIMANNTDEGPQAETRGRRLVWTINPRTGSAPMALIRLPQ